MMHQNKTSANPTGNSALRWSSRVFPNGARGPDHFTPTSPSHQMQATPGRGITWGEVALIAKDNHWRKRLS